MVCADLWCPDVAHATLGKSTTPGIIHQVFYSTVFHVSLQRWQIAQSSMWSNVTLCFGDLGEPVIFCNLEWIKEDHPTTTSARHIRIFQLVSNHIQVLFGVHVLGLRLLHNPPPWNLAWEARRRHLLESDPWSWGSSGLDTCRHVVSVSPALTITRCADFSGNFQLINSEKHWKSYGH